MQTNTSDAIDQAYSARKELRAAQAEAKRAYKEALALAGERYAAIRGELSREFKLFDQDAS